MNLWRYWSVLLAPDPEGGGGGGGGGAGGNPPAPQPPGPPAPPGVTPPAPTVTPPNQQPPGGGGGAEPITMTSQQLSARLERERSSFLRGFGLESEQALRDLMASDQARREQEEQARREQLTREQQLQEDAQRAAAERDAARQRAEEAERRAEVIQQCAVNGVRNVDYAMFLVDRARAAVPAGQAFDVGAFLLERVDPANEAHTDTRNALGIATAPAVVPAGVTTTPPGVTPPTPPPAGGTGPNITSAFDMDQAAWQRHKATLGIP